MGQGNAAAEQRKRGRIDLGPEVSILLDEAAELFGMARAEVLRRLIKGALQVGPALSTENSKTVIGLTSEIRSASRGLGQLLGEVRTGRAVSLEDALPILSLLHERLVEVDQELTTMTLKHGAALRAAAELEVGVGSAVVENATANVVMSAGSEVAHVEMVEASVVPTNDSVFSSGEALNSPAPISAPFAPACISTVRA